MDDFIELRQTSEDDWKAKYQGNYGIYTIKVKMKGGKAVNFSCTCPSDYYPCKHISYIEDEIARKVAAAGKKHRKGGEIRIEDLIKPVPADKLREFIAGQAKYNNKLYNAVLLEFAANIENKKGNKYSRIIQKALASIDIYEYEDDYYDYDSEDDQDIDILDQWFEKARDCIKAKQYNEALLVCKACIEELSQWLHNMGENRSLIFSTEYQSVPFDILEKLIEHTDKKELFNYCLLEVRKRKYVGTDFEHHFYTLLGNLAPTVDPEAFIALQDELLAEVKDMNSSEAKEILQRKIDFYRRLGKANKAWALMEENIRIESFRRELTEKKIKEGKFQAAKKLINDFLAENEEGRSYPPNSWYELLLDIAQQEKDIPSIQAQAYRFLENHFTEKKYKIYKAAFNPAEWPAEYEKLFLYYSKRNRFSHSAADLLAVEGEAKRLLQYTEKYLSIQNLERYEKYFAPDYPEETLELFRKVLVSYMDQNTGRSHYEYILSMLKRMLKIKGGEKTAAELAANFRAQYKNRKAMLEILAKFKPKTPPKS